MKTQIRPPDTIYLMFLCFVSGLTQAFGSAKSDAVNSLVPTAIFYAWAWILVLGAGISLVGIFWGNQPLGMLIEVAGRWMLWPTSIAYGIATLYYSHNWFNALLVISFGAACFNRIRLINRLINEWKELVQDGG